MVLFLFYQKMQFFSELYNEQIIKNQANSEEEDLIELGLRNEDNVKVHYF